MVDIPGAVIIEVDQGLAVVHPLVEVFEVVDIRAVALVEGIPAVALVDLTAEAEVPDVSSKSEMEGKQENTESTGGRS